MYIKEGISERILLDCFVLRLSWIVARPKINTVRGVVHFFGLCILFWLASAAI